MLLPPHGYAAEESRPASLFFTNQPLCVHVAVSFDHREHSIYLVCTQPARQRNQSGLFNDTKRPVPHCSSYLFWLLCINGGSEGRPHCWKTKL